MQHAALPRIAAIAVVTCGFYTGLVHAVSVNGTPIPETAVMLALEQAELPDTSKTRDAVTQQLITQELFRQEALKDRALNAQPEVQRALNEARANLLTRAWLQAHLKPEPVTEAQVKARYEAIVADLGEKDYKPRVIAVADQAAVNSVLTRLKGGEDFAKVAQTDSLAANKDGGGAMDWVNLKTPVQEGKTGGLPFPLAQALVALPSGGVSAPVVWNDRYFVMKLDDVRLTKVPPFDAVKPRLREALEAQAVGQAEEALAKQLRVKAKITQ